MTMHCCHARNTALGRRRGRCISALVLVQLIGPLLRSGPVTAIQPEETGLRTGETDSVVVDPGTVTERIDHVAGNTNSIAPSACFLTPWREECERWLEEHVGGMWVGGSLCVGCADLGDLLCGMDMAGFVEKADYSLSYLLDPRSASSA